MSSTLNGQVIGTWTLVPTTYPGDYYCSPGYKGSTTPGGFTCSTGTGKCLNFEVGARFVNMTKWPDGSNTNWFTESINFRGHMDHFTLGVDGVNVAYDFEPAPGDVGPRNVFTNQRNLNKSLTAMGTRIQNNFMFKITGKVKNRLNAYFDLDDGTGNALPTRVYWMNNFAQVGQTWEVWGFIERARWSPGSTPYLVWTDDSHARRID